MSKNRKLPFRLSLSLQQNVRLNLETEASVSYYLASRIFPPELNNEFLVVKPNQKSSVWLFFCMVDSLIVRESNTRYIFANNITKQICTHLSKLIFNTHFHTCFHIFLETYKNTFIHILKEVQEG